MMTYSEFIPLHLLITRVYAHPPLPLREGWASAAPKPGFLSGAPGNFWRMQWIPTQGLGKVVVSGVWLGVMGAWSLWILG